MDDQYLTEKHYLVCNKGITPKQMKVTSQTFTRMGGHLAATEKDTLLNNNFVCVGGLMFAAGMAAGVCACIPGPGWVVAAAIAVALVAVAAIGYIKCKSAAASRIWTKTSPVLEIQGKKALLLSSVMECPVEGGVITPKETFWAAWGSQTLTNLGHIGNFAYGFLAGRGIGSIATTGAKEGLKAAGKEFLNTAKTELVEQFTFKGWKNAGWFCKAMRGLGVGGAYYEQYQIWSSDKDTLEKLKESSVGLIMSIFAAKGATTVCFPAGTKVHTNKGVRNIEELGEGDLVLTYNEQTQEQEYKPILVKHERYTMSMTAIELPTGEMLQVTPEHRFYHNGEWIGASSLKVGDLLHLKNGDYTCVMNIEVLPHYEKVYNFDIADNENYYVTEDGILVHNGYRPIDKAKDYEDQVRGIYDNLKQREFSVLIDGQIQNRIADAVTNIGDDLVAIEAKYVDNWKKSISNPSHIKDMPFLGDPKKELLEQAKAYSEHFDKVIYHTNSRDFMEYYSKLFDKHNLKNIEWILTPVK